MRELKIAPSILSADLSDIRGQVALVEEGGADYVHLDVMDGHFVPNITFGPVVVKAVKSVTRLVCDVHLMITDPDYYLEAFAAAGADICTVHAEALNDPGATLDRIKALGMKAGLTINPDTPVSAVLPYLDRVDQVLIMSVFPGFSGQKFIPEVLKKVEAVASAAGDRTDVEIDGGINARTAGAAVRAGANVLVAATAIFGSDDIPGACRTLRQTALDARREE